MSYKNHCPHEWTQKAPFIPTWVRETPSPKVCPHPIPPVTPNPSLPKTSTLQQCTPLQLEKAGPCSVSITVSIPAESMIHLPTKALEIKTIKKTFKLTQSHFFNCVQLPSGAIYDTPKLFIGGVVRKDIQYSEAVHQTSSTVTGVMRDFVVEIPISCVIDLGRHLIFPPIHYDQQKEYSVNGTTISPSGVLPNNLNQSRSEFNLISKQFYNSSPACKLVFCQINEADSALDCMPLQGGPPEECTFTTLQEKMVILIQLGLTFTTQIDYRDPCYDPNNDYDRNNDCCYNSDSKHRKVKKGILQRIIRKNKN